MGKKKPYVPPRLTAFNPEVAPRNRFYTRYPFEAEAEIISDRVIPSSVLNISFGGCRLRFKGHLLTGAAILVKIHTTADTFEATAKVVHSSANEAGIMFDSIGQQSLLVLHKWITAAKSAVALAVPNLDG